MTGLDTTGQEWNGMESEDSSTQPSGASDVGSYGLKSVRKMTSEVRNVSHVKTDYLLCRLLRP